eukprot:COSAG01_NODE_62078_length_286_cov_0.925134_1_plen_49_part_10
MVSHDTKNESIVDSATLSTRAQLCKPTLARHSAAGIVYDLIKSGVRDLI